MSPSHALCKPLHLESSREAWGEGLLYRWDRKKSKSVHELSSLLSYLGVANHIGVTDVALRPSKYRFDNVAVWVLGWSKELESLENLKIEEK